MSRFVTVFFLKNSLWLLVWYPLLLGSSQTESPVAPPRKQNPCKVDGSYKLPTQLLRSLASADVLVLGEEHGDKDGHSKELAILRELSSLYPLSLSMEMLEWHQEIALQEYLAGTIPYRSFASDSQLWKNFTEDYLPLLDYAKSHGIPVVAANPPRRYVNLISRKGMLAFREIPPLHAHLLPQPQNVLRDRSSAYEARLKNAFRSFHSGSHSSEEIENQILAQHAWDAGMTERILREYYRSGNKILHLNGRFHSDYEGGVPYRLKKAGLRVFTATLLPDTEENRKLETSDPKIADFLIFTGCPIE